MPRIQSFGLGCSTGRISQLAHHYFRARRIARRFVSTPTPFTATASDTAFTCLDYFCISNQPVDNDPSQRGGHVLDVDLRLPYGHGISQKTLRALERRVEGRLAGIVVTDNKKEPEQRIDAIRANAAGPTKDMWIAFKDLNPRHLSIIGGVTEDCYFEPLRLMTTWNRLESIYLGGLCGPQEVYRLPPFVLRTLKTLDLHMCLTLDIRAVDGAAVTMQLENLGLHINDVGLSAAMLLNNHPSIKNSLRCLSVDSSGYLYDWEEDRTGIRRMLTECTKLTDVKLSLRLHHAVYIAAFLPPALQRLEFAGERSMALLPLLDDWIARAKDPKWAPNLRFLKFTVDRERLSMPDRFFLTEVYGDDEDPGQVYPPGVTVTLPAEETAPLSDDQDLGFDEDRFESHDEWYGVEEDDTDDLDEVDLGNLPGIGPHPNHVPKKVSARGLCGSEEEVEADDAAWRCDEEAMAVSGEALAEFEVAFAAKKEELYKILRDSRPDIELV